MKIFIEVLGGNVCNVYSSDKNTKVVIVDYDNMRECEPSDPEAKAMEKNEEEINLLLKKKKLHSVL